MGKMIIVDMTNKLFSDAVSKTLSDFSPDFIIYQSEHPDDNVRACTLLHADILLMEVTAYKPRTLPERMKIRDKLKEKLPGCRIVLLVDENIGNEPADSVRQLKKDGLIDDFVYGSVNAAYLSAIIDTI